jgi:hypothetical protein
MEIEIIFKDAATPKRVDIDSCYTKRGFFVIRVGDWLTKYPMDNIFSILHKHGYHWGSKAHLADVRKGMN